MDSGQDTARPVLALHGFTLGGAMFSEVADLLDVPLIAPDLPGHGGRDATNTSWDEATGEVLSLVARFRPSVVLGYSMGGRLAVAAALSRPELFPRLVLASTSLGIEDAVAREERRRRESADAAAIVAGGAEDFLREFAAKPFLQAPGATVDLMALRLANQPSGIAAALRGLGQGSQPYLGGRLAELVMPTTWIAGRRDEQYVAIATEAAASCPDGSALILDAAHNVIAEQPTAVAATIAGR